MNLPEITAFIGSKEKNKRNELALLVKNIKKTPRQHENFYIVSMTFDLNHKEIVFEDPVPFSEDLLYKLNYFGNNSAAAAQYYLVRETDSLNYLLTSVWNDLLLYLRRNALGKSELAGIIEKIRASGLISVGAKKGEGSVALDKIVLFKGQGFKKFFVYKKALQADSQKFKFEEIIRQSLDDANRNNKFVLVVPAVRDRSKEKIILSIHPDYLDLVKKENNLGTDKVEEKDMGTGRVCYVCHLVKSDTSSKYTTDFDRSGINKIFTTTTINSARQVNGAKYDDNYAICKECYQNMLVGEKVIKQKFSGYIAGENAFIIPEGILDDFDYTCLGNLKEAIDFAFKSKDAKEWVRKVEADALFIQNVYVLNLIIYRTDGNSVTILEAIEDIPLLRFTKVMNSLAENANKLRTHLKGMSLGNIYRMIPVKTSKKKGKTIQADIGRVLSLYKVLLSGGKIAPGILFAYASEALDKGLRQLSKDRVDNYKNLSLLNYVNGKEDFFIKKIIMSYLILIKTCQQLGLLDSPVFEMNVEEDDVMTEKSTIASGINDTIKNMDIFLQQQGFNREAKALYYLGALVNRVAVAQYNKEHKTKPILKKINFQGMTRKDILRLYEDVVEKLRQYNKLTLFSEHLMNKFHENYGSIDKKSRLSEHTNVFYIMSGYSYMVGNKAPDLTDEERKAVEESNIDQNEEQNQDQE